MNAVANAHSQSRVKQSCDRARPSHTLFAPDTRRRRRQPPQHFTPCQACLHSDHHSPRAAHARSQNRDTRRPNRTVANGSASKNCGSRSRRSVVVAGCLTPNFRRGNCASDPSTLQRLVSPSIEDGQPAPAQHFGDPRVMALLACLCSFQHLFAGLTNRILPPADRRADRRLQHWPDDHDCCRTSSER